MSRAAIVVLVAAVLAGCGGSKSTSGTTTRARTITSVTNPTGTSSVTTHGRYKYPPVVVNNFMRSCTNGSKNKAAYCRCALDSLSDDVSLADFQRIGVSGGTIPKRIRQLMVKAASGCRSKLGG